MERYEAITPLYVCSGNWSRNVLRIFSKEFLGGFINILCFKWSHLSVCLDVFFFFLQGNGIVSISYHKRDVIILLLLGLCSNYTPRFNKVKWGYTGFSGQNRVHSVSATILAWSISYLHILSSNFKMCVACIFFFFFFFPNCWIWSFGEFFKLITLTLSCYDLGCDMNH